MKCRVTDKLRGLLESDILVLALGAPSYGFCTLTLATQLEK